MGKSVLAAEKNYGKIGAAGENLGKLKRFQGGKKVEKQQFWEILLDNFRRKPTL